MFESKRTKLFTILAAFLVADAVIAEMIGGKLIQIGPFTMSIGILPWPLVFLVTDVINEYFGKKGVRRISFMAAGMVVYSFLVLLISMSVKASSISPVSDDQFSAVFGQSMWIIVGSIIAFLASQLIDVVVFWYIRSHTGNRFIWLRATGSTVVSQLIDTFIVAGIAFWLPGKVSFTNYINMASTGYLAKLIIAILVTPLIYVGHHLIHRYLGESESIEIIKKTAENELDTE